MFLYLEKERYDNCMGIERKKTSLQNALKCALCKVKFCSNLILK